MRLVDWDVARATATRLVPPGPRLPLQDAIDAVEQLRELSAEAHRHVLDYTGLDAADGAPAPTATIVDRPGWVQANVDAFAALVDPLLGRLVKRRESRPGPIVTAVGSRAAGVEVGLLLAYLSTRVLGQFELFGPASGDGRLLLVAPNIVVAERALDADPREFRLWVCLHEQTHRTQFAAAPWLADHVRTLLGDYLDAADLDPAALLARLRGAVRAAVSSARSANAPSLLELVQTPQQRAVLDRITGLMSLLEGHADVVMDGVGPAVLASVETIRRRFERRRNTGNPLEKALRRLLGLDLKLRQYAEGARFVRAVVDARGMQALNQVWSSADLLPDAAEIRAPERWLARVA